MPPYTKIYMKHFGYQIAEDVFCEVCKNPATSIHHIYGRGKNMDVITNLMAVCIYCHTAAHTGISKSTMQKIHNEFLQKHSTHRPDLYERNKVFP